MRDVIFAQVLRLVITHSVEDSANLHQVRLELLAGLFYVFGMQPGNLMPQSLERLLSDRAALTLPHHLAWFARVLMP